MALSLTLSEMLDELQSFRTYFAGRRFAGLFANDVSPDRHTTIAGITPAFFSGYVGLQLVHFSSAPYLFADRGVMDAAELTWTRAAGPNTCKVWGYYVVDSGGRLCWAALNPGGPVSMSAAGQSFKVIPQFSLGSRYPVL